MQSLKDDAQHQHSTFLEWTIVLLITFEIFVEVHALGWIEEPPWLARRREALELRGSRQQVKHGREHP